MDEARLQQTNARKSWCQYFHQEILDAAKAKTHQKYLTCGEYLTRIAYYLIGAIGDLPPPLRPSVAQETPTKRKRAKAPVQPKAPQPEEESSSSYHSEFQMDTDEEGDTPIASKLRRKYKEFTKQNPDASPSEQRKRKLTTGSEGESETESAKLQRRERRTKMRHSQPISPEDFQQNPSPPRPAPVQEQEEA